MPLTGDATNLSEIAYQSIDVVFSNSVIEHLFTFENQRRMAFSESQRRRKSILVRDTQLLVSYGTALSFRGLAMASGGAALIDYSEASLWLARAVFRPSRGASCRGRGSAADSQ